MNNSTCAVILAGGQGNRMKSDLPKPMMKVLGIPMLEWVMKACGDAGVTDICVVTGFNSKVVEEYIGSRCACVLQSERLGTAHAVMSARGWLSEREEKDVLILCGDAPFIDSETVGEALSLHRETGNGVTVITAEAENPTGYGRILRKEGAGGSITGIIEEKNADGVQRAIREVNSGAYWFKGGGLKLALEKITPDGLTGEYYLTDSVSVLIGEGLGAGAYLSANAKVILGANDRMGLLRLNDIARYDIIEKLCKEGVGFLCTDGVYIEPLVKIGKGTEILQGTTIRGNAVIGENCLIGPGSL
jgi:bifunctional UDP-N-acetylglucosamine pyrophosphorylase/glucosamine-1-phosphate N-acetyltransferase